MSTPSGSNSDTAQGGGGAGEELRLLLDALLGSSMGDLQAWAQTLRAQSDATRPTPTTCSWCPLCAAIALIRGERPELAVRLAQRLADLVDTLREVVDHHESRSPRGHQHGSENNAGHAHHGEPAGDEQMSGEQGHSGNRRSAASDEPATVPGFGPVPEEPVRLPHRVQRINLVRPGGRSSGKGADDGSGEPMC